ncbi:hypothetical protein BJX65DRAFT_225384 [Aspergillus insuetus]
MLFVNLEQLERQIGDAEGILRQIQLVLDTALPQSKESSVTQTRVAPKSLPDTKDATVRQNATLLLPILMEVIRPGFDISIHPMKSTATLSCSMLTLFFRRSGLHPGSAQRWRIAIIQILPLQDDGQARKPEGQIVQFEDSPSNSDLELDYKPKTISSDSLLKFSHHSEIAQKYAPDDKFCVEHMPSNSLITVTYRSCGDQTGVSLQRVLKVKEGIARTARVALALELARAFVAVFRTGFIPEALTSENVWFMVEENKIVLGNLLLPVRVIEQRQHLESADKSESAGIFRRACTALGIVLIDILLGTEIIPCSDLDNDNAASYQGRPEVVRGLETIRYEFGAAAANAVRHCVCRVGLRFDPQAQRKAFTQFVILPLEKVLKLFSREESGLNGMRVLCEQLGLGS